MHVNVVQRKTFTVNWSLLLNFFSVQFLLIASPSLASPLYQLDCQTLPLGFLPPRFLRKLLTSPVSSSSFLLVYSLSQQTTITFWEHAP